MVKDKEFLVRADETVLEELGKRASELGLSKAELIRKSLWMVLSFIKRNKQKLNEEVMSRIKSGESLNLDEITERFQKEMLQQMNSMINDEITNEIKSGNIGNVKGGKRIE